MARYLLPLPTPPELVVAEQLTKLRHARRELADAHRVIDLLAVDQGAGDRDRIETAVAKRRAELWAGVVAELETSCRALGVDVSTQL